MQATRKHDSPHVFGIQEAVGIKYLVALFSRVIAVLNQERLDLASKILISLRRLYPNVCGRYVAIGL